MENFNIENRPERSTLTAEQVQNHIESAQIRWVKAVELLHETPEACVDGRRTEGAIGTPGGNAGEFILFLAAAEAASGREINSEEIDGILARYLQATGKFYMHTDSHALEIAAVRQGLLGETLGQEDRQEILEKLTRPENIGCGHIRNMMQNPEQYGVRAELVKKALEEIIKASWKNEDIEIEVLKGEHTKGAVVNVVIEDEVDENTEIPAIPPNLDGEEMFVNHPQVAGFLRREISREVGEIIGFEIDAGKFSQQIKTLAEKQLKATVGKLADGLPIYNAVFDPVDKKLIRVEKVT